MKTPEELAEEYGNTIHKDQDGFDLDDCRWSHITEWEKRAFLVGYAAAQPKWISAKERLPKVLESVLVVYAPTNEAKNDHRMECWNWPETEVYEKKFITYWMPLPELPKENE